MFCVEKTIETKEEITRLAAEHPYSYSAIPPIKELGQDSLYFKCDMLAWSICLEKLKEKKDISYNDMKEIQKRFVEIKPKVVKFFKQIHPEFQDVPLCYLAPRMEGGKEVVIECAKTADLQNFGFEELVKTFSKTM